MTFRLGGDVTFYNFPEERKFCVWDSCPASQR
jgi:hypothetical protein